MNRESQMVVRVNVKGERMGGTQEGLRGVGNNAGQQHTTRRSISPKMQHCFM